MLRILLQWAYPNGRSHCSNPKAIETEATSEATNELPNMSLDSEVIETEAPKNDMITVDLKTQDAKQNYKTKALKMSKGSMPQMSLAKRRGKCGKVRKIQTPRMYKKKLKSQLNMRAQWSLKSKHKNNTRLHNKTLNTKFMAA